MTSNQPHHALAHVMNGGQGRPSQAQAPSYAAPAPLSLPSQQYGQQPQAAYSQAQPKAYSQIQQPQGYAPQGQGAPQSYSQAPQSQGQGFVQQQAQSYSQPQSYSQAMPHAQGYNRPKAVPRQNSSRLQQAMTADSSSPSMQQHKKSHRTSSMGVSSLSPVSQVVAQHAHVVGDPSMQSSNEWSSTSLDDSIKQYTPFNSSLSGGSKQLPPLDPEMMVMRLIELTMRCLRTLNVLAESFVKPVLSSDFQTMVTVNGPVSVAAVLQPILDLRSFYQNLASAMGFDNDSFESLHDTTVQTDRVLRAISAYSDKGFGQVCSRYLVHLRSMKQVVASFNHSLMAATMSGGSMRRLWNPARGAKNALSPAIPSQVLEPIHFLLHLDHIIELLSEHPRLPDRDAERCKKALIRIQELTSAEQWTRLKQLTIQSVSRKILQQNASWNNGDLMELLTRPRALLYSGFCQKPSNFRLLSTAKPYQFLLLTDMLVWLRPSTGSLKGFIVLNRNCWARPIPKAPSSFQLEGGRDIVRFSCESESARALLVYTINRAILAEARRPKAKSPLKSASVPSGKALVPNGSKGHVSAPSSASKGVSLPFNVKHNTHVSANMKWNFDGAESVEDAIQLKEKVGSGAFGEVYRAQHVATGLIMAVKVMECQEKHVQRSLKKEMNALQSCQHPNIVQYYGCAGPDKLGRMWILMDYCEGGSAHQIVKSEAGVLDESQIAYVMFMTLKALAYLHDRRVIHRDVKGANILLNEAGQVRLTDFGVSKDLQDQVVGATNTNATATGTNATRGVVGSPFWMSPEALQGKRPGHGLSYNTDVWSLGITAIELAIGSPPNCEMGAIQAALAICQNAAPTLPPDRPWSTNFRNFISRCLMKDNTKRPSANFLLEHPFVMSAATLEVSPLKEKVAQITRSRLPQGPSSDKVALPSMQQQVAAMPPMVPSSQSVRGRPSSRHSKPPRYSPSTSRRQQSLNDEAISRAASREASTFIGADFEPGDEIDFLTEVGADPVQVNSFARSQAQAQAHAHMIAAQSSVFGGDNFDTFAPGDEIDFPTVMDGAPVPLPVVGSSFAHMSVPVDSVSLDHGRHHSLDQENSLNDDDDALGYSGSLRAGDEIDFDESMPISAHEIVKMHQVCAGCCRPLPKNSEAKFCMFCGTARPY